MSLYTPTKSVYRIVFVNLNPLGTNIMLVLNLNTDSPQIINITPVDLPPAVMKDVKSGSRQNLSLPQLLLFAGQCLTVYVR